MTVDLERFAYTPMGTFGRISLPEFRCFAIERPWQGNEPFESCIPCGKYVLAPSRFHRGGYDTFEVVDVPRRSLIKIHIGNTQYDVQGCLAPGYSLGIVNGLWAVQESRRAFGDLIDVIRDVFSRDSATPTLTIRNRLGDGSGGVRAPESSR